MKTLMIIILHFLSLSLFSNDVMKESIVEIKSNTWIDAKLNYELPTKYERGSSTYWSKTDGFCDSIYRSKTGSILIRTGIRCKKANLNPGYYSNTSLEWNLSTNKLEVIDVFNWAGGSGGGGKLLAGFKENPSPAPRHTYDGMAYVPEEDAMYLMLGANWKICLSNTTPEAKAQLKLDENSTWKFTFKDRKWSRIDGSIRQFWNQYRASAFEGHMVHWPEGNKLLYIDSYARCYAEFDLKTQKWAKVKLKDAKYKGGVSLYSARTAWDHKRGLWIFRKGARLATFNPKDKSFTRLPDCWSLPKYPSKKELAEMKKNKINVDPRYHSKGIAYSLKHDIYLVTGPTGNDTMAYDVEKKSWSSVKGGDIKLVNGYLEYDDKTDLFGLVVQHWAYKFRYVPEK